MVIQEAGYVPMIYGSASWLHNDIHMEQAGDGVQFWVASYQQADPQFRYEFTMNTDDASLAAPASSASAEAARPLDLPQSAPAAQESLRIEENVPSYTPQSMSETRRRPARCCI